MEQDEVKKLVNWQYFLAATDAAVSAGRRCIAESKTPNEAQEKIKEVIGNLWRAGATLRYRDKTPLTVTMDELLTAATDVFPPDTLKKRD